MLGIYMGFIEFFGGFVKNLGFLVGGFIIAFPIAGSTIYAGVTSKGVGPVVVILGIILFVVGIAMMAYATRGRR